MPSPGLLVYASNDEAARCIIKGILKDQSSELKEAAAPVWNIENKYYRAGVRLHSLVDGKNTDHFDLDSVEAFIIYINNYKGESLATADKRKEILSERNCEVNILLCDKCDEMLPREQALVWCLDNDYQLIELHEEPETEPVDESCTIKEYYGIERVIQTLHAHAWSNHKPKHDSAIDTHFQHLPDGGEGDDELEYMDQFCKLFAQMSSVTQNASSMQSEDRKAYAEQVVKAFWKAIGGDESELEDSVNS